MTRRDVGDFFLLAWAALTIGLILGKWFGVS